VQNAGSNENPDRILISQIVDAGLRDTPFVTNLVAQTLGAVVCEAKAGYIRMRFSLGAIHVQGYGAIHGGIVSTALDTAMALAALSCVKVKQSVATINLNVNFVRAAQIGDLFIAADIVKPGSTMSFVSATATDGDRKIIATASAAFAVLAVR